MQTCLSMTCLLAKSVAMCFFTTQPTDSFHTEHTAGVTRLCRRLRWSMTRKLHAAAGVDAEARALHECERGRGAPAAATNITTSMCMAAVGWCLCAADSKHALRLDRCCSDCNALALLLALSRASSKRALFDSINREHAARRHFGQQALAHARERQWHRQLTRVRASSSAPRASGRRALRARRARRRTTMRAQATRSSAGATAMRLRQFKTTHQLQRRRQRRRQ